MTELRFDDGFQCFVRGLSYHFSDKHGTVYMDEDGCVDMTGCIATFLLIDPEVKFISTINETDDGVYWKDTSYRRNPSGEWSYEIPPRNQEVFIRKHFLARENWTLEDVAAFTKKSMGGVRAAVANGRLPPPHFMSDTGVKLWSANQVKEWMADGSPHAES